MDQNILEKLEKWIDAHFDEIVEDVKRLVRIPSVATYDEPGTPYGAGCKRALDTALEMARGYGFETHNYEDHCGSMTLRPGKEPGDEISFWGHLDVVPPGEGWQITPPYEPVIRGDYLIGRGADDNKGSVVGVMYLLRALEELKIPTRHGLRLFVGCDEEHGMHDVQYYAANYPSSKLTLIPDCGFPACYGEKGIIEANIVTQRPLNTVTRIQAGMASNIVPDKALLELKGTAEGLEDGEWTHVENADGHTLIHARGISRHSAFPEGGVNAIHEAMGAALESGLLSEEDARVMAFFKRVNDDFLGTALGINTSDEVSGYTTCTGTMASLREDGRAVVHVNIRYCITAKEEELLAHIEQACRENGCALERVRESAPNYFPRESPVVDALTGVFNEMTGLEKQPYVMGGGTYARKLKNALGFGMGGLEREETDLFATGHGGAHQPDEGLYLKNYKRALLIFAMGLLEADRVL